MHRRTADRLTLGLALAGLMIAGYLTVLHYDSSVPLVCSAGSLVNCETVLSSPSATVAGVPVAVWGVAWFVVALVLMAMIVGADARGGSTRLRNAALAWIGVATLVVLYLVYQEVGVIGKLCAWCTAVHAIVIGMLVVQVSAMPEATADQLRAE